MIAAPFDPDALDFTKGGGLVTVVAQDARSGAVLMVAHADREAIDRTLATGEMHYRSRSRGLWHKGATSGNVQRVVSLALDCDGDAVLARVLPAGPACHTGATSCFGDVALGGDTIGELDRTISSRAKEWSEVGGRRSQSGDAVGDESMTRSSARAIDSDVGGAPRASRPTLAPTSDPQPPTASSRPSYTARLLADRNLRLKKIGEEAAELVTACADGDAGRAAEEGADLLYHTLVALHAVGADLAAVREVLASRAGRGR
ncbi:MAG TPA: phosphoribosyl-AMP cyclohydrolase [Gemmatimonadaceae bacterium]|nr:phosphoribosyl-AMP cyclohydrolase [Gemmatimonadaceae bacterium]